MRQGTSSSRVAMEAKEKGIHSLHMHVNLVFLLEMPSEDFLRVKMMFAVHHS